MTQLERATFMYPSTPTKGPMYSMVGRVVLDGPTVGSTQTTLTERPTSEEKSTDGDDDADAVSSMLVRFWF